MRALFSSLSGALQREQRGAEAETLSLSRGFFTGEERLGGVVGVKAGEGRFAGGVG